GRGDVRGQGGRALLRGAPVLAAAASLYRGPARLDPAPRPRGRAPERDRGHGARRRGASIRLSIPSTLPLCSREMLFPGTETSRSTPRPFRRLLASAAVTALLKVEG